MPPGHAPVVRSRLKIYKFRTIVADVAQTTSLRLLERIDRIEYSDGRPPWLAATSRNECLRSLAVRKRAVLARDGDVLVDVVAGSAGCAR